MIFGIKCLPDNIFVCFRNIVFCQTDGIPQGRVYAPLIPDCVYATKNLNLWLSFNLRNISTVNNLIFLTGVKQMYPNEHTLNKTNITNDSCQYLNLDISPFSTNISVFTYPSSTLIQIVQ